MTDYNIGDLVEAVKGENVIRGRIHMGNDGRTYELGDDSFRLDLFTYLHSGYTITVIEKAARKVELPTKTGTIVRIKGDGDRHWLAWKSNRGDWDVITPRGELERVENYPADGIVGVVESVEVLESRAETAKAVLEQVSRLADGIHPMKLDRSTFDICVVGEVAKTFGVE